MTEDKPSRLPRVLSCLVKGPLGCLFFLVGALTVGIFLLPFALGRLVDRGLERGFAKHFAGQLEISDAWVGSLYGPQRLQRLVLRDPRGDEVLRADVRAPRLDGPWNGPPYRYGPVEVHVEVLRIVQAEDGSSNLEEALRVEGESPFEGPRAVGLQTDVPFRIDIELTIDRLRFPVAGGREEVLENLRFLGTLEWGPEETRLELAGGSPTAESEPLRARLEVARPEFGPRRRWSSLLELERAPVGLARVLCGALRPIAAFSGPRVDRLQWSCNEAEVVLRCEDEGARFELLGARQEGEVLGADGGRLSLSAPCGHAATRALFGALFPGLEEVACREPSAGIEVGLEGFTWPLDGDPAGILGRVRAVLPRLRARPGAELADWGPATAFLEDCALDPASRIELAGNELRLEDARLASPRGWMRVAGTVALVDLAARVTWDAEIDSAALPPRSLGTALPDPEPAERRDSLPAPAEIPTPPAPGD